MMAGMDVAGWLALADHDPRAAQALARAGTFLPVGFHCQQAIGKTLKALYTQERAIEKHGIVVFAG
jgi:HEPN domain-containing protein